MIRRAATLSGLTAWAAGTPGRTRKSVHVILLGAPAMQGLNRDYLGHDAPTDVLAFDLRDDSGADEPLPVVAEIYICLDVAVNAASQYSTSVAYEVLLYIVHGMLHLVGENDHEQIERRRMRRAETRVMRGLQAEFPLDAAF